MLPDDHSATSPALSATGSFVSAPCPKCGGPLARRSHRDGLAEKMLSLIYVYPFRCQLCDHRFFSLQWGMRYHRVPVDHREYHRHLALIPVMLSGQAMVRSVRNERIGMEFLRCAPADKDRLGRFIESTGKRTVPGFNGRMPIIPDPHVNGVATQPPRSLSLQ